MKIVIEVILQAVVQLESHQILRPVFLNRMFSNPFANTSVAWQFPLSNHLSNVSIRVVLDILQNDRPIQHHE